MVANSTPSMKAKEETSLIDKNRVISQESIASLMTKNRDSIYYMLLKMVNNPHDAEDLTMDTFANAYRSIDTYTNKYAFSTWLFSIATNVGIDFLRKKKASQFFVTTDDAFTNVTSAIQSDTLDPEEAIINEQAIANLRKIVNRLKSPYKEIVELRYYKEYSYEEIAEKLNMPIGTVKSQLFRAKTLLYNIFKNHHD